MAYQYRGSIIEKKAEFASEDDAYISGAKETKFMNCYDFILRYRWEHIEADEKIHYIMNNYKENIK